MMDLTHHGLVVQHSHIERQEEEMAEEVVEKVVEEDPQGKQETQMIETMAKS